jgi:ABC-type microcin C transport system permease subunit YejB
MEPIDRRIEGNFSRGWPTALFITALVVGAFATAGLIHKNTYRHPRDTTAEYRKEKGGEGEAKAADRAPER